MLRAAGADIVLLLAVLHDADRLAALVERALEIGLEPLVEVHDETRARRGARVRGAADRAQQPRPAHARRRRRASVASPRVRARRPAGHRRIRRSRCRRPSPAGARSGSMARSSARRSSARRIRPPLPGRSSRAGAAPDDPANVARRPFVKICGVTDLEGVLAAVASGADAIGLNVVPGTPRELALDEAADLARIARAAGGGDHRPAIVAITADATADRMAAIVAALDPDVVQLSGTESVATAAGDRAADLEGPARTDDRSRGRRRRRRRPRLGGSPVPRSRGRPDHARRGRRAAPGRHRDAGLGAPRSRGRARAADRARRWTRTRERRGRPADRGRRRRRRRLGRRAAARAGRASDQGPAPRRPLRQARPRGPRRPAEHPVRADARPSRPARGRRRRPVGAWKATSAGATCRRR